jgi:CRISPR/Cas system-associated protein endoribonuclease Cas2
MQILNNAFGTYVYSIQIPLSNSVQRIVAKENTTMTSMNKFHTNLEKHLCSRHQITFFKVTAKSYNAATRTAEPRRVKTAQKLAAKRS